MSTFVLVHGICHGSWCWSDTVERLAERGHRAFAVDLPLTSLADDAATVARTLDGLDGPVILVGHSYGGLVISVAAAGRSEVQQLVYVAAVMLDADDVFIARTADFPAAPLGADVEITDGQIVVPRAAAIDGFFNCCDAERAAAAAARLRPTNAECLAVPPGVEPWREVPSTYILCEQDRAHPPRDAAMDVVARRAVFSYDTDHSPFISMNDRLVDDLDRLASG